MSEAPRIAMVYIYSNGMVATFDQKGRQMPDYDGPKDKVLPLIKATGYTGPIKFGSWFP